MCNDVKLPPIDYAERIRDNLNLINNPNADIDSEHTDIQAAALNDLPLNNDFLADETYEVGRLVNGINQDENGHTLSGFLVDRGNRNLDQFEYGEIFSYVERRADRPIQEPTEDHRKMMAQWLDGVQNLRDLHNEIGDHTSIIGLLTKHFIPMVRNHLPKKLDFKSWVGEIAKQKLEKEGYADMVPGELVFWEPRMGTATAELKEGIHAIRFIGTGGEGRLVWRYYRYGVPMYHGAREIMRRRKIAQMIATTEENLIRLSIQVANWLAWFIVVYHAQPLGAQRRRRALNGADLIDAVVEILGHEWFELPFDTEGKLKEWKLKRTICMDPGNYLAIMHDRSVWLDEELIVVGEEAPAALSINA